MVTLANSERYLFAVSGLSDRLRVLRLHGTEAVNQPFHFELELLSESAHIDFDSVVNHPAHITLIGDETRYVNGIVSSFRQGPPVGRFHSYRAILVPAISRLRLRQDCRIFQEMAVPDIVKEVLEKGRIPADDFRFTVTETHEQREYCVQYRETDWDFITRLLAEEGIYYFFEHQEERHLLVMADNIQAYRPIPGGEMVKFHEVSGGVPDVDSVHDFDLGLEMFSGKSTLRDFNFKKPSLLLQSQDSADQFTELEIYDYPGDYREPGVGDRLVKWREDAFQASSRSGAGRSTCVRLTPGHCFALSGHPADGMDARYMATSLEHTAEQPQVMEESAGGQGSRYGNGFQCVPAEVLYRPKPPRPRPLVGGPQTAIVVGPPGEEIYTDEFGRVKVQFHWDRLGKSDDKSSCWIRVSQVWAGAGWGAMYIPRIGQEVVVDFLEGDPDRPLVTGRVYHGTNRPPYPLPADKTRSTIKSNTSPDGGGSNELRFEDKKGDEEVYLHGQKDWSIVIENDKTQDIGRDESSKVGRDRHKSVARDQDESVGRNKSINVGENHSETIGKDASVSIGNDLKIQVGKDVSESVGGGVSYSVGKDYSASIGSKADTSVGDNSTVTIGGSFNATVSKDMNLQASDAISIVSDDSIALKAGGASIVLKSNGDIVIKGSNITVKASGDLVLKGSKISEN